MKKNCLFESKLIRHTKILFFVCISAFFALMSCSETDDLEEEIIAYQQEIDSILVNIIVPKKNSLHAKIEQEATLSQESIDIAYQVIPINTAQFLISSQSDTLTESLKLYKSKKIKAKDLIEKLNYSKAYVDSLLISNVNQND